MSQHNIVIVGVGALGSHLVQLLRNFPANIKIIDFDRVEQKNVMAQFHGKIAVGKNKTQALQQLMNYLFARKIEVIPHKLTQDNVDQLLKDATLIIDCLDNAPSRQIIQDYVKQHQIPCLHGALDRAGSFGVVCWDEQFEIEAGNQSGLPTCENGENLPFIAIVSSYLTYAAQRFIMTGKKDGFQINPVGVINTWKN